MIKIIKKIVSSKIFLLLLSVLMFYLALKKVDIKAIWADAIRVPWWFVVINLMYQFLVLLIIAFRWTILAFDKSGFKETWNFVKGIYIGMFYSLFFPSAGSAIDAVKWLPISIEYPNLKKSFLLGTMVVDRLMTLTAFYLIALIGVIAARIQGFVFPDYIFWLVVVLFGMIFSLALLVFFGKIQKIKKVNFVVSDKKKLLKCFGLGLVTEVLWILPIWWISNIFGAGMSIVSIYLFVPIVMTALILPISFSGFGAREYLYMYFFGQVGLAKEKVILVSTFFGTTGIINCLIGGIFPLLDRKLRRNK